MKSLSLKTQKQAQSYGDKRVGSNKPTGEVKTTGKSGKKTMKVSQPLQNSSSNNNIIKLNNPLFVYGAQDSKNKLGVLQGESQEKLDQSEANILKAKQQLSRKPSAKSIGSMSSKNSGEFRSVERSDSGLTISLGKNAPGSKEAKALFDELDLKNVEPRFGIDELFANVTGKHNVGELKLKRDGSLAHVNSHAGVLAAFNNEKLTPAQNLEVRKHVCQALLSGYENENVHNVVKLLLNKNDRYTPLSRDEVFFLFMMLAAKSTKNYGGMSQQALGRYTVENFEKLHKFKMGLLTDGQSTVTAKTFVKGLQSKDPVAKSIASALTVNAQQNLVSSVLDDLQKKFLSENPGKGSWDFRSLDEEVKNYGNLAHSNNIQEGAHTVTKDEMNELFDAVKREYGQPKSRLIRSEQEKRAFIQNCKKDICGMLKEKIRQAILDRNSSEELILDEKIKIGNKKETKIVNKKEDKKEIKISDKKKIVNKQEDKKEIKKEVKKEDKKEEPKDNVEANKKTVTKYLVEYEYDKDMTKQQQQAFTNIDYKKLAKACKVTLEEAKQLKLDFIHVINRTSCVKAEFLAGSKKYWITVESNGKVRPYNEMDEGDDD